MNEDKIENLSRIAMDKLNHGTQREKTYAIGMLKVVGHVRELIKNEKDDEKLLTSIKKLFK
jgi:hypothetical protein